MLHFSALTPDLQRKAVCCSFRGSFVLLYWFIWYHWILCSRPLPTVAQRISPVDSCMELNNILLNWGTAFRKTSVPYWIHRWVVSIINFPLKKKKNNFISHLNLPTFVLTVTGLYPDDSSSISSALDNSYGPTILSLEGLCFRGSKKNNL